MASMPGYPVQGYPMQGYPAQGQPNRAMPMAPPQFAPQPRAGQPPMSQWQPMQPSAQPPPPPSLAQLASGMATPQSAPTKARGVAGEPAPAPPKFVLPSPEELGIRAQAIPSASPPQAAAVPIDWNQVHARMDRLGVLRQERNRMPTGAVRVMLLLPTRDPALGQPVEAIAETEASAIALALERAEAWAAKR